MKIILLLSMILAVSFHAHAAGGTFSRDPASAADDLAADSVGDANQSDYENATRVIANNLKPFQACFNVEVERHPGLSGRATAEWSIDTKGNPTNVRLIKSDIKAASFDSCMRTEFAKLKFSPPSPKTAQPFSYPFVFVSENSKRVY